MTDGPVRLLKLKTHRQIHLLKPFHKVYKRIKNGMEDSLGYYFAEFIPAVMTHEEQRSRRSEPETQ